MIIACVDRMLTIHPVCSPSRPSSLQPFVRARLSGLGQNKDLAGSNPIRGHETLTFDPTCDTSGSVVPQVSIERANTFPAAVSDAVLWPVSAGAAKTLVTFVFVTR